MIFVRLGRNCQFAAALRGYTGHPQALCLCRLVFRVNFSTSSVLSQPNTFQYQWSARQNHLRIVDTLEVR